MIRKFIAGVVLAALAVPLAVQADDEAMVAAEGRYELFTSTVGDSKGWAVVDTESGESAVAEEEDGEVQILTGDDAQAALQDMRDAMPHTEVLTWSDRDEVDVLVERLPDEDRDEVKIIRVNSLHGGENAEINIEKMLEDAGVSVNGNITVDTDEGKKHIVIRTGKAAVDVDVDADIDADDGAAREEVRKVVRIVTVPEAPDAPPAPGDVDVRVLKGDGRSVVVNSGSSSVYTYNTTTDGENRSFIHVTGVDADAARDFIEDIDDLTLSEKDAMKQALSL